MNSGPRALAYAFLGTMTLFVLLPLAWALSTSFKNVMEAAAYPPRWFPDHATLDNYRFLIESDKLIGYFINSIKIIAATVVATLLISIPAAYAAARGKFSGKESMISILWGANMLAGVAIIFPLFLVSVKVGLYDDWLGLVIVYTASSIPTAVWLLRGFVARVPYEIEEAAQIDGCSRFGAFLRMTLPLLWPGVVATIIFIFVTVWNDFLIAYGLVLSDANRTVQIGIYFFVTDTGVQWGRMMAAVILSCLPVLVLYAFLQKSFVQGLGGGAVKD